MMSDTHYHAYVRAGGNIQRTYTYADLDDAAIFVSGFMCGILGNDNVVSESDHTPLGFEDLIVTIVQSMDGEVPPSWFIVNLRNPYGAGVMMCDADNCVAQNVHEN